MRTSYNMILVTPDDDATIDLSPSGFRVYTATEGAAVKVRTQAGEDITLNYPVGVTIEDLRFTKIYETGTDVADVTIHAITDQKTPA